MTAVLHCAAMLDQSHLTWTLQWCSRFHDEWKMEVPLAIHKTGERGLGSDGTPDWTQEFSLYLSRRRETDSRGDDYEERDIHDRRGPYHNNPERIRTTSAFRKLRRHSPAEFIVAYRLCVLDPPPRTRKPDLVAFDGALRRTARWLNERAIARGTGETFTPDGVALLAYAAVDKLVRWAA